MDKRCIELAEDRAGAERKLKELFGFERFHDHQWAGISRLLRGQRVLMIERTGFGKSLCFQFPAMLMEGVTIVFSPLIALMRDQVAALKRRGIPSECLNSENDPEENERIIREALAGRIKILYIAPERQENEVWSAATHKMNVAMVVIDEAHTVSVWGHDFRPAFRRIIGLVHLLPPSTPVLALTATATPRVQTDIERQIGGHLVTLRGDLLRDNFRFHVIEVESEEDKLIWLARHINILKGSGIIYTGTRDDTDRYTSWLRHCGIDVQGYNAGLESEERKRVEQGLMESRWKCIVSTNALGMGIDKSDIRFVVHTQIPASPVHYYQEIGRAGRDGKPAEILLFFNSRKDKDGIPEDCRLPLSFINNARPERSVYERAIAVMKDEMVGERELAAKCNLRQTEVRIIKADLLEQGIIKELKLNNRKKFEYQYDAPELDTSAFEELRRAKLSDLEQMVGYVSTSGSRMAYLCSFLGDDTSREFVGCDNTTEPRWSVKRDERYDEYLERLAEFISEDIVPLPAPGGKRAKLEDGVAAGWWRERGLRDAILSARRGEAYSDIIIGRLAKAWGKIADGRTPDMITASPQGCDTSVARLAGMLAKRLGIPYQQLFEFDRPHIPQEEFRGSYARKDNVAGRIRIVGNKDVKGKMILMIDDFIDSGATLSECAYVLNEAGARKPIPLVIAKINPGDKK